MKLVRIEHTRCSEWGGNTHVFAPDDWSPEDIQERVNAAQRNYLDAVAKLAEYQLHNGPPVAGNFESFIGGLDEGTSIKEGRKQYEAARRARTEWEAQQSLGKHFESYLDQEGFVPLWGKQAPTIKAEADWGHRHGTRLKYGTEDAKIPSVKVFAKALAEAQEWEDD